MYVFGLNLPVAEILFVAMLLFLLAIVFIIVQLVKMQRHIRVLDTTTLEIRRYEGEEERVLRPYAPRALRPTDRRFFTSTFLPALSAVERRAAEELLKGQSPAEVRSSLLRRGVSEPLAVRAVNNATYALDQFASMPSRDAQDQGAVMKAAGR